MFLKNFINPSNYCKKKKFFLKYTRLMMKKNVLMYPTLSLVQNLLLLT